jgi:hypothetical protein
VFDLAAMIADECAGFLDRTRAPQEVKILDIYDETISNAVSAHDTESNRWLAKCSSA